MGLLVLPLIVRPHGECNPQRLTMKRQYFGDSYDIVKKSLIAWLSSFGSWATHPMFTESFEPELAAAFSRLLGTSLLSESVLTPRTNRADYFSPCRTAGNLFLDPDTGVCLQTRRHSKSVSYVFGGELVEWPQTKYTDADFRPELFARQQRS